MTVAVRRAVSFLTALAGLTALACLAGAGSTASAAPQAYATRGQCAGHPRVDLRVPAGWCAGLVATAAQGLQMPRRLLEVAPHRFWIVDMGSWEQRRGRLLELRTDTQPPSLRTLASGLDRPHGLARGPDGQVYVGEAGTVWRTPVADAVRRENVITGLPADGAHPLKELAFGRDGQLYINVGSATDACRNEQQQQPLPCPETSGPQPRAAVYRAVLGGPQRTLQSLQPHATGLRNSLGLAVVRGARGTERLWQAENSVDYPDAQAPAEELNELVAGSQHGWPGCVSDAKGRSVVDRGYEGRARCGATQRAPRHAMERPPAGGVARLPRGRPAHRGLAAGRQRCAAGRAARHRQWLAGPPRRAAAGHASRRHGGPPGPALGGGRPQPHRAGGGATGEGRCGAMTTARPRPSARLSHIATGAGRFDKDQTRGRCRC